MITPSLPPRLARICCRAVLFSAVLLLCPSSGLQSAAQPNGPQHGKEKPYALIFGTVWGPDDRPVYGVPVRIRRATDKPNKVRWEVYSDHHGEFAQRVPAGECDYVLWSDLKHVKFSDGKPRHLVQPVTVHVYNDEREDTGLHLAY